jgi:hypothetical protein
MMGGSGTHASAAAIIRPAQLGGLTMRSAFTLALLLATTVAEAQQPAPAEPAAYCRSAAQALFQASGDSEYAVIRQKCRRGDTIAINTGAQGAVFQVARLCDFTKSIVTMGSSIVCVLMGERGIR